MIAEKDSFLEFIRYIVIQNMIMNFYAKNVI